MGNYEGHKPLQVTYSAPKCDCKRQVLFRSSSAVRAHCEKIGKAQGLGLIGFRVDTVQTHTSPVPSGSGRSLYTLVTPHEYSSILQHHFWSLALCLLAMASDAASALLVLIEYSLKNINPKP